MHRQTKMEGKSMYYEDDFEYEKETWYAMTDGMYGDMPEDFNGDFDWLGF